MTNTVKRLAALLLAAGMVLPLGAQNRGMGVQVNSPVVNPDNTVTFNYRNANAKDVKVNVQFAGTHDMIAESHTRLIARSLPNAKLCLLGGDHFIAAKQPDAFNRAVLEFLRGIKETD